MADQDSDADGSVLKEGDSFSLYVTAIDLSLGACRFWAQCHVPSESLSQLESLMNNCQKFIEAAPEIDDASRLDVGDLCFAKFSEDGVWYRARVWCMKSPRECTVFFVDYGNVDTVPVGDVKLIENVKLSGPTMTSSAQDILFGIPAQATECILAHAMPVDQWKWSEEAETYLKETLAFEEFTGVVDKSTKEKALIEVKLSSGELLADNLIKAGFARSCDNSYTLFNAYTNVSLPIDYEDDVCIACCVNPEQFWVHLKSATVDEVTDKVTEFYSSIPESELQLLYVTKGCACVAKYAEDDGYYRAKVTEVLGDKYRVQFIDFGNSDVVPLENVRAAHFSLFQQPVFAIECALEGVRSIHKAAAQRFIQLTVDQSVRAVVAGQNQNKLFISMYNFAKGVPISIAGVLLKEGLIEFCEGEKLLCGRVHLDEQRVKLWSFHSVYVTHVESPSSFVCQLASNTSLIDGIMNELAKACAVESNEVKVQASDRVPGFFCSAQFTEDDLWYRAQIIKPVDDDNVEVKYIDFGNCETVPVTRLQYLPVHCCQPIQGVRCSLAYAKPAQKEWSKQQTEYLQELAIDKSLIAYILSIDKYGQYVVELASAADCQSSINTMVRNREQETSEQQLSITATSERQTAINTVTPLEDKLSKPPKQMDVGGSGDLVLKANIPHTSKESPLVLIPPNVELGSKLAVLVSSVESVSNFHCQLGSQKVDQLQDRIQKFYASHAGKLSQPSLKPNVSCCAQFTEDDEWYRAEILSVDVEEGKAKVMYVDYGNTENLSIFRLKQLLREFYDEAVHCIVCCLPENTCRSLAGCPQPSVAEKFEELVAGKEIRAVVVGETVDGKKVVELIDQNTGADYCEKLMEMFGVGKQQSPIQAEMARKAREDRGRQPHASKTTKPPPEIKTDPVYAEAKLKEDSTEEVLVTHYVDPENFWCQLLRSEEKLNSLMADINAHCEADKPAGRKPAFGLGALCLAQYSENVEWYRAVVTGVKHSGDLEVMYVDYGNTEILSPSKVKEMPEKFTELPVQAVHCSLTNVIPSSDTWTKEQVTALRNMIENQAFTARIHRLDPAQEVYSVELVDSASNSINDKFGMMTKTLARPTAVSGTTSSKMQKERVNSVDVQPQVNRFSGDARSAEPPAGRFPNAMLNVNQNNRSSDVQPLLETDHQQSYKRTQLLMDEYYDVFVSFVTSPGQFVCQLARESNRLDELMNDIAAVYSKDVPADLNPKSFATGLVCCAQFTEDDGWYRAQITGLSGQQVTVKYIDYGNSEVLPRDRVKELKPEFMKLPAQAIECSLFGVRPVSGAWTADSAACFQELTGEKKLVANVTAIDKNGTVTMELQDTNGPDDAFIKDELVALNHAIIADDDAPEKLEDIPRQRQTRDSVSSMVEPAMTSTPFDARKGTPSVATETDADETLDKTLHKAEEATPLDASLISVRAGQKRGTFVENSYEVNKDLKVTVSHVNSPIELWCQPAELSDEFYGLLDEMKAHYDKLKDSEGTLKDYLLGSQCVAKFSLDESWYRAAVIGRTPSHLKVLFVDYGNAETVPVEKVKEIDGKFMKMPVQAFQCGLSGFTEGGNQEQLQKLVGDGQILSCRIVNCHATGIYEVNLMDGGKDVGEQLRVLMKATVNEDNKTKTTDTTPPPGEQQRSASIPDEIEVGQFEDLLVSHVDSASRLWCNLAKNCNQVYQLLAEMGSFYEAGGSKLSESVTVGRACAAKYVDGSWYRAVIREIEDDSVCVFFIDFGNEDKVDVGSLRMLDEKFRELPPQAVECVLQGVADSKGSAYTAVQDLTADKQLVGRVLEKTTPKLIIELFDTTGERDVNINEEIRKLVTEESERAEAATQTSPVTVPERVVAENSAHYLEQRLESGSTRDGYVSHVDSIRKFFVQFAGDEEKLAAMETEIQRLQDGMAAVENATAGLPCCARDSVHETWCRARIESVSDMLATVRFVDYGNSETVPVSELKVPNAELLREPPFAVECTLENIGDVKTAAGISDYFMECTLDKNLQITFVSTERCCKVKVTCDDQDAGSMISEKFEMAAEPEETSASSAGPVKDLIQCVETLQIKETASVTDKYKKHTIHVGETYTVYLSSVESPWKFWCQVAESTSRLTELDEKIQDYCAAGRSGDAAVQAVTVGMPCLAFFAEDKRWYRGRVTDIGVSSYTVLFVDYGNSAECEIGSLRTIPQELIQLEEQSVQCCLSGIGSQCDERWSHESEVRFEEVTLEVELKARVVSFDGSRSYVQLFSGESCIADVLVKEGLVEQNEKCDGGESEREDDGKELHGDTAPVEASRKEDEEAGENVIESGDHQGEAADGLDEVSSRVEEDEEETRSGEEEKSGSKTDAGSARPPESEPVAEECAQINLYTIAEMEVSAKEEAFVSVVSSVSKVYCHVKRLQPKLDSLAASLQLDYSRMQEDDLQLECTEIGTACAVQNHKDGRWYRAIICGQIDASRVEVFYVDYGNVQVAPITSTKQLKKEYFEVPALAVKCYIREVIEAGLLSTSKAMSSIRELVTDKTMTIHVIDRVFTGVYLVELYDGDSSVGQTMLDILKPKTKAAPLTDLESHMVEYVQSPAAKSQAGRSPFHETFCGDEGELGDANDDDEEPADDATTGGRDEGDAAPKFPDLDETCETSDPPTTAEIEFQQVSLAVGFSTQVYYVSQTSPDLFICQFADTAERLDSLHAEISEHCSGDAQCVSSPVVGQPCLVQYSKDCQWYRAVITATHGPQNDVYFVDYGNCESVSASYIRAVPLSLAELPMQAIKCRLANVAAVGQGWSEEAIALFEDCCHDKLLTAEIVDVDADGVVEVKLLNEDGADVCLTLVAANHATWKSKNKDVAEESHKNETMSSSVDEDGCTEITDGDDEERPSLESHGADGDVETLEFSATEHQDSVSDTAISDVWKSSDDHLLDTTEETQTQVGSVRVWHDSDGGDVIRKSVEVVDISREDDDVEAGDPGKESSSSARVQEMAVPEIKITQYDDFDSSCCSLSVSQSDDLPRVDFGQGDDHCEETEKGEVEVNSNQETEIDKEPDHCAAASMASDASVPGEVSQPSSEDGDEGRVYSVTDEILMDLISKLHLRGEPDAGPEETSSADEPEGSDGGDDHANASRGERQEPEKREQYAATELSGWTEGTTSDVSGLSSVELARDAMTSGEQTEIEVSAREDLEATWDEGEIPEEVDFAQQLDMPRAGGPVKDAEYLVLEEEDEVYAEKNVVLFSGDVQNEAGNVSEETSECLHTPMSYCSDEMEVWFDVSEGSTGEQVALGTADERAESTELSDALGVDTSDGSVGSGVSAESDGRVEIGVAGSTDEFERPQIEAHLSTESDSSGENMSRSTAPPGCLTSDSAGGAVDQPQDGAQDGGSRATQDSDEGRDLTDEEMSLIRDFVKEITSEAAYHLIGVTEPETGIDAAVVVPSDSAMSVSRYNDACGDEHDITSEIYDDDNRSEEGNPDLCVIGTQIQPICADDVRETSCGHGGGADNSHDTLHADESEGGSVTGSQSEKLELREIGQVEVTESSQGTRAEFDASTLVEIRETIHNPVCIQEEEEDLSESVRKYQLPRKSTVSSDDWVDINTDDMDETFTADDVGTNHDSDEQTK